MMDRPAPRQRSRTRWGWQALTLVVMLLAFGPRLYYAVTAQPFVDEPTTLLVARAIAQKGWPVLPSGLFYGNDLPFSYLAGAVVALTGPDAASGLLAVRLVTVAAATLTTGGMALAGRRFFGPWVGLWAALLVALDPEAILWGARARAYGVLGLLAWGGLVLFYAGTVAGDDEAQSSGLRYRRAGLVLMVVALFVHPEAALLLAAAMVAVTLQRGPRWWLGGGRWIELLVAAAAAAGRYGLQLALARGMIGSFQTVSGSRPPVELAAGPLAALGEIAPFFVAGGRLPWTLLAVAATVAAGWAWYRQRRGARTRAALFFCTCLWLMPLGMVLLMGRTYQSPRYLTLLIPLFALCAAVGLSRLLALVSDPAGPSPRSAVLAGAATLLLFGFTLPAGVRAAGTREKGFEAALEVVAQAWQPGDRVATVAPAACHLYLGRCDYLALGIDYEEFAYRDAQGRLVDRWLGTPLVRTAGELSELLAGQGRLWLVTDETRLRTRFEPDFAALVWQHMEAVARTDDVLVFRSVSEEAVVVHDLDAVLDDTVRLAGYALPGQENNDPGGERGNWVRSTARAGDVLPVVLYWQAVAPVPHESVVFVHLTSADGQRVAQDDGPPLDGVQPMTHWRAGETLADRRTLTLPADLPPGRYRLTAGLYDRESEARRPVTASPPERVHEGALILDYLVVLDQAATLPAPQVPVGALFTGAGDEIRLLGYDLPREDVRAGEVLELVLYWQAVGPVQGSYNTFAHLLDSSDQIAAQDDGPAAGGFYPSSLWDPGESVVDHRLVTIAPGTAPGSLRLAVGLYVLEPPRRLTTPQGDRLILAGVRVTE